MARADLRDGRVEVQCFAGCQPEATLATLDRERLLSELRPGAGNQGPHEENAARAVAFSNITCERVEWLIPGRVPLGALTLLVGDPGLGKSLLTCAWAGDVSNRGRDALLVTAEDAIAATVRPRLEAVGADLGRVHAVEVTREGVEDGLRLPDDIDKLDRLVADHRAQLVVVDPLMAHLPENVNSWRDQSVRRALAPLHRLAEAHGCAVVVVAHLNKAAGTDPLYRVGGSIGIGGAARSVILLARDPDDPEDDKGVRRVLAHVKCNIAPLAPSLAYRVEPMLLGGDERVATARLVEHGESGATSAQLLSRREEDEAPARTEAEAFLRAVLNEGPHAVKEIERQADEAGIAWRTVERAKSNLGVRSRKAEGTRTGPWVWVLPGSGGPLDDRGGGGGLRGPEHDGVICEGGGLELSGGGVGLDRQHRHDEQKGGSTCPPPRPHQTWIHTEAPHHRLRVLCVERGEARLRIESSDRHAGREVAMPLSAFGGPELRRVG